MINPLPLTLLTGLALLAIFVSPWIWAAFVVVLALVTVASILDAF